MALVSISEAARLAGVARSHFYKAYMDTGKISISRDVQGKRKVDTSEVMRVFGVLNGKVSTVSKNTDDDVSKGQEKTEVIVCRDDVVSVLLQQLKETKQDASEREHWYRQKFEEQMKQINDLTNAVKLLEHQRPTPFWKRWFN